MKARLNSLKIKIERDLKQIEIDRENNKKVDYYQKKLAKYSEVEVVARNHYNALSSILLAVENEDARYKSSRIGYLQDSLSEKIDLMFPYEVFEPSLNYETVRGKNKVSLTLKDMSGCERNPFITEGKFMQELIGFVSSMSVIELLGTKLFLIDEAFSAASEENKIKVGELLQTYIDQGIQVILISQDSNVYSYLNRREINLSKNLNNSVSSKEEDIIIESEGVEDELDLFTV